MTARTDELPRLRALRPNLDEVAFRSRRAIASELFGVEVAPTRLGRYELHQRISTGGMGVVWAAFDPTLSREVGIKLVRGPDAETVARRQARFVREMRALALLNHPNVLPVYDVGSYDRDPTTGEPAAGLYMVTELVRGTTLDVWLADRREHDEIFAMFLAIGDGLAAAHEQGLMHRDFKPANVLVDQSGRPRVIDFGLVRAVSSESGAAGTTASARPTPTDDRMTADATILGTPRYMAPEQLVAGPIDARADQYAFCLVLAEALLREPLFLGESLAAVSRAKLAGPPRDRLRAAGLSSSIRRALERGLHPSPSRRHLDMRALLHAIAAGRARWRKIRFGLLGAVAALGIAGAALGAPGAAPCDAGPPLQVDNGADAALAAFAHAWTIERDRVCAPAADRAASASASDCLRRQRETFTAMVEAFEASTLDAAQRERAVASLEDPSRCSAAPELVEPSDGRSTVVRSVEKEVASARALFSVGQEDRGLEVIDRAVDDATRAGPIRLRAWVLAQSADLHRLAHRPDEAAALYERAYYDALRADDPALAFRSASGLASHEASLRRDPWEAERWIRHAEAAAEAGVELAPRERAELHHTRGVIAHAHGDPETAYVEMRTALQLDEQDERTDPADLAVSRVDFGRAAAIAGRLDEAIDHLQPGATALDELRGPKSRKAIVAWLSLADALRNADRLPEARAALQTALDRTTPDDPEHAYATWGLADLAWRVDGDATRALALYDDAHARLSSQAHPDAFDTAAIHHARGSIQLAVGRADEAHAEATRAIALLESAVGAEHPALAPPLQLLADSLRALGRADEAAGADARAEGLQ